MTHTRPMAESEGTLSEADVVADRSCPKCRKGPVVVQTWESRDGAYEDSKFTCQACHHTWWVDGPDA